METVDVLIDNGLVVTMDDRLGVIADGAVAVRGDEIVAVGPADSLRTQYQAGETIDARGGIVLPGLINAHTHAGDALFRGLVGDMPLEPWLNTLWKAETRFVNAETVALAAQLAIAEMIRSGTTTALDMFWFPEVTMGAAKAAGFRLISGPIYFDPGGPDQIAHAQRLAQAQGLMQQYQADPLIHLCVQPHGAYTVSPQHLQEAYALSAEFNALFHTHASETRAEVANVQAQFGHTPLGLLDTLGLLGPRTVLAHVVHPAAGEVDLLAARGAMVVHNPLSNLKLGSGIAPLAAMHAAGVPVLLGTDGPVSSNDLDLWMAMRFAALLHRGAAFDPTINPAPAVVRMVTIDAAMALGLGDRIGSLTPGKRADLIVIDTDRPHLTPIYDVWPALVFSVGRGDVRTVLINGQTVMRERQLQTVDEARVLAAVRALAVEVQAFVNLPDEGASPS